LLPPQGIAVSEHMTYVALKQKATGRVLLVAKDRLPALDADGVLGPTTHLADIPGRELVGASYAPLFGPAQMSTARADVHRIHASAHVSPESGTGFVHCAPAHGMEDYHLFRARGLLSEDVPMVCHVDALGRFASGVEDVVGPAAASRLVGLEVLRDGSRVVMEELGEKVVWKGSLKHRYPIDWKTKEPVIVM
jgi:isoleucyl-tRNA synthetase